MKTLTPLVCLAAVVGCLILSTAPILASYAVTEAELEERLSKIHGEAVGSAMAARVFQSFEIPTEVIEQRLIGQYGARWDTFSPDRRERLVADHRELLTNAAHAEAERAEYGEFDPDAHEPRPPRELPDFSEFLRPPLIDSEGNLTTGAQMREARLQRSIERISELREHQQMMRRRAEESSLETGHPLRWDDSEGHGSTELIVIDDDGRHRYYRTMNYEGAHTISTDGVKETGSRR